MPLIAVIGAQWGDEGKGKVVDLLAEKANLVVRFSGGPNAGHTVSNPLRGIQVAFSPLGHFLPLYPLSYWQRCSSFSRRAP